MNRPVDVFIAYSLKDEHLFHEFSRHLKSLRGKYINSWDKGEILGGEMISKTIEKNIKNSDLVLAMISSDFLAEEYVGIKTVCEIYGKKIIPIKLRPFSETEEFSDLQFLPKSGSAVTTYENLDLGFKEAVEGILEVIKELGRSFDYGIKKTLGIDGLKELSLEKIFDAESISQDQNRYLRNLLSNNEDFFKSTMIKASNEMYKLNSKVDRDYDLTEFITNETIELYEKRLNDEKTSFDERKMIYNEIANTRDKYIEFRKNDSDNKHQLKISLIIGISIFILAVVGILIITKRK